MKPTLNLSWRWLVLLASAGSASTALAQDCSTIGDESTVDEGFDQAVTFSYTGGDQSFTVPPGTARVKVQAWGAGGGGFGFWLAAYWDTMSGGAGGYTEAVAEVEPGDELMIMVGGGGQFRRSWSGSTPGTYGGGGGGNQSTSTGLAEVGAGGGLSGVFLGAITQADAMAIAGGGGGSGDGPNRGSEDESSGGNGNMPVTAGHLPLQGQDGGDVSTRGYGGGGGGYVGGISGVDVFSFRGTFDDAGEGGHGFVAEWLTDGSIQGSPQTLKQPPSQDLAQYVAGVGVGGRSVTGGHGLVVLQLECTLDEDGDGIEDALDECPGTELSDLDAGVPSNGLGVNRWADLNGDGVFETTGSNPTGRAYTFEDTAGCSCAQIIDECAYGNGHTRNGCSHSVMDWWTGLFDQAGESPLQCH